MKKLIWFIVCAQVAILYRINKDLAMKQIPSLLNRAEKVLASTIVEMIVMDLMEFGETPGLRESAVKVAEIVKKIPVKEFRDKSEIELFLKTFYKWDVQ